MKLEKVKLNDVAVVTLTGDVLDANNVSDFKTQMTEILQAEHRVVFNMSQVQFMDSSGIGSILSCLRTLNAEGGELKICLLTKPVHALFELVRMHKIFDIFNSPDEAINSF